MSGHGGGGVPQDQKKARERRMRNTAKKQVHRAEEALHKYRARAAAILNAEGLQGDGAEGKRQDAYVYRILRHRETGVRVRVLDTEAPDAPASAKANAFHRYSVECQTHGTTGDSFVSAKAALAAARHSDEWCSVCADLMSAKPKARSRARLTSKHH
jgi:hypothetical protein